MIVGQSIISATVNWSCVGSLPCSWESLLGEGSFSLNDLLPLLSHWNVHHSCNSPCVDLQFSPSGSSWGEVCLVICWNVNVTCASLTLKICRMVMSVIYCGLWSGKLRNSYVWMICGEVGVVCHGGINGCNLYMWGVSVMSYSWSGCQLSWCCDLEQPLYELWWLELLYLWDCDLEWLCLSCLHGGALHLIWHGGFCEVWVGDVLLGFQKEVSCVDNPWQCDHTYHTWSI